MEEIKNVHDVTESIALIYNLKPVERDKFTLDWLLSAYKRQGETRVLVEESVYADFVRNFVWTNPSAIDFVFHFLENKVFDLSYFTQELVDICKPYGENISLKRPHVNSTLKFKTVDSLNYFDPDNINLVLTDEKEVKKFRLMIKNLNQKNKLDFTKETKRGQCHQNLKIDNKPYYQLIEFINISHPIVFSKYKIGANWYRTKAGESFLEVAEREFISTREPTQLISFETLLTKKPILLGRISIFNVNGFNFIWNEKNGFLTKFFKELANRNNRGLKKLLGMFNNLSKVADNLTEKRIIIKQIQQSIKGMTFKTPEEMAKSEQIEKTINKINESLNFITEFATQHKESAKRFLINRDVALLALGKQKNVLPSFREK